MVGYDRRLGVRLHLGVALLGIVFELRTQWAQMLGLGNQGSPSPEHRDARQGWQTEASGKK
jgi:hypothetical protein